MIARFRQGSSGRFGPPAFGWRVPILSCALLVIAIVGGEYAVSAAESAAGLSPADRLTILQTVIAAGAVPLMLLAALFEESQAEHHALRDSQRRYALATGAGGVGVWEWSPSGTYVDPRLSHRVGYQAHTDANLDRWLRRVHPDDRDGVKRQVEAFVAAAEPFLEFECRVLNQNGSTRWLFVRGAATATSNDRPSHVVGTFVDVTEQRVAAQALAASETRSRELAGRVISVQEDERARIARNLHDSASQTLAALAIRLGVMHRDSETADPDRQLELAHLRDMAIRVGEQIRHFSHELHPAVLQRSGLSVALAEYCSEFARDHELRVTAACAIDHAVISAATALCFYRVCQEALYNVAKHAGASHVSVALDLTDSGLQLTVRDNGCGFDLAAVAPGRGIGLSKPGRTPQVIERHPRNRQPARRWDHDRRDDSSRRAPMTKARLVVADDDGVVRDALSALLARDYQVVALAVDGRQLVDAVIHHRPDVVVADIDMPELSGVDALRELQTRKIPVKVVFLTMHNDPRLAAEVIKAGAAGFVLKHSASIELHDAIQQALNGGRYVTPRVSTDVIRSMVDAPATHTLTPRQLDVLRLLAEGKRMKEIGLELNLATRTVENYKYELMDALGLRSTADVVRYALSHGLLRR